MVARTAGPEWSGPIRGPDFFGTKFFGPVRCPDFFGPYFLFRSVVRIFRSGYLLVRSVSGFFYFEKKVSGPRTGLRKNPDRYGLSGPKNPDHGPDQWKSGPRTGPRISGPKNPDHVIYPDRYGFSVPSGQPWLKMAGMVQIFTLSVTCEFLKSTALQPL